MCKKSKNNGAMFSPSVFPFAQGTERPAGSGHQTKEAGTEGGFQRQSAPSCGLTSRCAEELGCSGRGHRTPRPALRVTSAQTTTSLSSSDQGHRRGSTGRGHGEGGQGAARR